MSLVSLNASSSINRYLLLDSIPEPKKSIGLLDKGMDTAQALLLTLPPEAVNEIFTHLTCKELLPISENPYWEVLANHAMRRYVYEQVAFTSEMWKKCSFAEVEPSTIESLPLKIGQIFGRRFSSSQDENMTVGERCKLIWMPKSLTINSIESTLNSAFPNRGIKYAYMNPGVRELYGDAPIKKSYWVLVKKHVLDGSNGLNFAKQTALVAKFAKETKLAYEVPEPLEMIACAFTEQLISGSKILGYDPWFMYTRTKASVNGQQVIIGYTQEGLHVTVSNYAHHNNGVAVVLPLEKI
jgi:hypothetical protein